MMQKNEPELPGRHIILNKKIWLPVLETRIYCTNLPEYEYFTNSDTGKPDKKPTGKTDHRINFVHAGHPRAFESNALHPDHHQNLLNALWGFFRLDFNVVFFHLNISDDGKTWDNTPPK